MFFMMSILKTFLQCLKNLKDNFELLNEDGSDDEDPDKRELRILLT